MRTEIKPRLAMGIIMISIVCTQSCGGEFKDETTNINVDSREERANDLRHTKDMVGEASAEVRKEVTVDMAIDNWDTIPPDVIGDVLGETLTDTESLDIVDTLFVPCPDGELTLEYAMTVMNKMLCNPKQWNCGGKWESSPQCYCEYYSKEGLDAYMWSCSESAIVMDAFGQ